MKIEKDAEWLRLEGKAGQLRGDLSAAVARLTAHANESFCKQVGLVPGETVVVSYRKRFLFSGVHTAAYGWICGAEFKKDGTPSVRVQNLYADWTKEV